MSLAFEGFFNVFFSKMKTVASVEARKMNRFFKRKSSPPNLCRKRVPFPICVFFFK